MIRGIMKFKLAILLCALIVSTGFAKSKPNVILIICDDLNDYVEPFGGHWQVKTPAHDAVGQGRSFVQAGALHDSYLQSVSRKLSDRYLLICFKAGVSLPSVWAIARLSEGVTKVRAMPLLSQIAT